MQNISLRSLGMSRKQISEIVFGFKSDSAVLTFTFRFLSSIFFSFLLPHFLSFAVHLVGFILVGKVFGKAFRILGLVGGGYLVSLTELCSFWYGFERSL